MTSKKTPITIGIVSDAIDGFEAFNERKHYRSTSDIIRTAIKRFDFESFDTPAKEQKQISLRIEPVARDKLKSLAKTQGVSVRFLIRQCILNFISEDATSPQPRVAKTPTLKKEETNEDVNVDLWQI